MEHRFGRTLRVFLVVLAAAGFYRLAVVPWVEPRVKDLGSTIELSPEQAAAIRARADKRLAALGDIFPEGSWERDDPIMLESRQMRLLFKQYHSLPDGRVNLVPCTLVILPDRNRAATDNAGGRTLVLRAPQGAVLEFDEPLDLRQGRLAKLIGGSLRGQVTIRGTATAPDAEDDIEIATRDVELADLEIRTGELVQFRYGRSTGSGRALVARLLPRADAVGGKDDRGPNIGGVDSIRLDRDVRMRLEGLAGGLLPGREEKPAPLAVDPAAPQAPATEAAPVLVSCRGSLCLNVSANVITFEDHVDVVRTGTGGASDQLACELLAIRLARGEASPAVAGGQPGGGLRPVEIQARGAPVVARSTASGLEARGARLGYEIATRRILLDGDEPVALVVQGTEMEARSIDYCPGPEGDPGALMAVGPGWLKARSPGSPPVPARWQKWLRMRPDGTGHVASIAGEADVTIEAQGRLSASEMHLWLDVERPSKPAPQTDRPGPRLDGVKPSRMLARGMVEIDTEQLTARTDRMELWFKHLAAAPVAATAVAQPGLPGTAAPATPQPGMRSAEQGMPNRGKLVATGGLVRGLVSMSPDGNQLEEISLENQVHLVEQPRSASGLPAAGAAPEPAIEIKGDQLQLSRATRFDARAVVSGRPAQVIGRGIDLEGPLVEFDRGRNRMTVDGAGRLRLPMAGGMNGLESFGMAGTAAPPQQPIAPPGAPGQAAEKLDVTWQGRMDFDGLTARFVDRVVTSSGATSLKAGSLDVIFNQPIDFSAGGLDRGGRRADVAKIACGSGVRIESQSIGQDGSKSVEKLFVRDLVLDRATGDVSGSGPGRLTSTRFGQAPAMAMPGGMQPSPGAPGNPAPPPTSAPRPDELTYLGVDFQRGMRGNVNRRMMEFHQRVEAIWGPVAGWEDSLDAHAPGGLPPRAIAITSEVLGVGQAPPAPGQRRNSIELMAGGNVLVEGESFTARSARLSWSEAKDLLVFEGDGRSDAQLFRQMKIGAPTSSASAGKILYWRALNRVDVDDARYLDLDQFGAGGNGMRLPGGLGGSTPAQPISSPVPGT
jgi:hypothetical protein